jgi:hypothetical protein
VSIGSSKKVGMNKDLCINFISEFWNTRNRVSANEMCFKRNHLGYDFQKRED